MNGRNRMTLIFVITIVACSSLAAIITIKDYNTIITDFHNFVNDPFTWDNYQDNYGFLNLYVSGDTEVENDTSGLILINASPQVEIYQLLIVINYIKFKSSGRDITIDLIKSPITIDLAEINNTQDLLNSFEIPVDRYSALHLYYDQDITADTSHGNKTFHSTGSGFIIVPVFHSFTNQSQTNISIEKVMGSSLLLHFQMQIRWQQMTIIPHIFGYKNF